MSSQNTFYPPVFIKDVVNSVGSPVSCSGTVVDITGNELPGADGEPTSNRPLQLVLDDGTGQLSVVYFRSSSRRSDVPGRVGIGDDLVVHGRIQMYRDTVQMKCDLIKIVQDPNIQTLWINQVIFYTTTRM